MWGVWSSTPATSTNFSADFFLAFPFWAFLYFFCYLLFVCGKAPPRRLFNEVPAPTIFGATHTPRLDIFCVCDGGGRNSVNFHIKLHFWGQHKAIALSWAGLSQVELSRRPKGANGPSWQVGGSLVDLSVDWMGLAAAGLWLRQARPGLRGTWERALEHLNIEQVRH